MSTFVLDARTATDHFPGIGRYVSNLAHALAPLLDEKEQLILLVNRKHPSRWLLPEAHGQVQHVEMTESPFSLQQQWAIPSVLKEYRASLYHSPYYLMPYRLPIPAVVTIYDLIPELFPQYVSLRARLLFRITTKLALRAAQQIITISDATRRDLLARYGVAPQQVVSIPLAADARFRPAPQEEIAALRERYRLPQEYVLYFGINKPHKNLSRLLDAWKLIVDSLVTKPCLVIAGAWDARYTEPLEKVSALELSSYVRFLGPVKEEELPALYSGAAAFVFPSVYEGFGLPVVEAMACKTAVACANTSSLPEIVADAALLFNPEQVEDIADTIRHLLRDTHLRRELQERGARRALHFSWDRTAAETLTCYRSIVSAQPEGGIQEHS